MLGYKDIFGEIYIFFENNDLKRLQKEKITGQYIDRRNNNNKITPLEVSINTNLKPIEQIVINTIQSADNQIIRTNIELTFQTYFEVIDTGHNEVFQNRQNKISLKDTKNLKKWFFFDQEIYRQLKKIYSDSKSSYQ